MARVSIDPEILTDIADSIRTKNHETSKYYPQNMAGKIDDILVPTGEIELTANGTYDVTNYASANVNTPVPTGTITINANGTYNVSDYASAEVNTPGITPTGTINITQNGTTDVTTYASANVNVSPDWTEYYALIDGSLSGQNTWVPYIKKLPYINVDSSITSMFSAFQGSSSSKLEEINFAGDTSHVTQFEGTFKNQPSLKLITGLNTSSGTNFTNTFLDDYNLLSVSNFTVPVGATMNYTFSGCSVLTNTFVNSVNFSNAISTQGTFNGCSGITSIDGDFSSSTYCYQMFYHCLNLATVGDLKVGSTTSLARMFEGCVALSSINSITTSSSNTTLWATFKGCSSLIAIPSFTTSGVTDFTEMCNQCTALTTVPVLDFSSVSGSNSLKNMFNMCGNLSDNSLNNIMLSCISCGAGYTGTKSASTLGLNATQRAKLSTLSAYNDFVTAGWSAS